MKKFLIIILVSSFIAIVSSGYYFLKIKPTNELNDYLKSKKKFLATLQGNISEINKLISKEHDLSCNTPIAATKAKDITKLVEAELKQADIYPDSASGFAKKYKSLLIFYNNSLPLLKDELSYLQHYYISYSYSDYKKLGNKDRKITIKNLDELNKRLNKIKRYLLKQEPEGHLSKFNQGYVANINSINLHLKDYKNTLGYYEIDEYQSYDKSLELLNKIEKNDKEIKEQRTKTSKLLTKYYNSLALKEKALLQEVSSSSKSINEKYGNKLVRIKDFEPSYLSLADGYLGLLKKSINFEQYTKSLSSVLERPKPRPAKKKKPNNISLDDHLSHHQ